MTTNKQEDTEIPLTTISRLFQTVAFEHEDTRITKQTLQLSSEYLQMFVKEAILRSDEARVLREREQQTHAGAIPKTLIEDDASKIGCLQVSDLEEISGLLVLDF